MIVPISPRVRRDILEAARTFGPILADGVLGCLAFLGVFLLAGKMLSFLSAAATLLIAIGVSSLKHSRKRIGECGSLFSTSWNDVRIIAMAALQGLGVVAIAAAIAAAPFGERGSASALAIRASIFLALILLVFRVSARRLAWLVIRPDPVTAVVGTAALLPFIALLRQPLSARLVWPMLLAAGVEELVYRVLLPESAQPTRRNSNTGWLVLWGLFLVAQVTFAMSHAAAGVALHTTVGWPSLVRLVSAGCLLASVRILLGLPSAVGLHALGNLAISSRTIEWSSTSNSVTLSICAASMAHLALSVRGHASELTRPLDERLQADSSTSRANDMTIVSTVT